jgi:hypothetical protein
MKSNFLIKFITINTNTKERLSQAALLFCEEEELRNQVIEIHSVINSELNKLNFLVYLEDVIRI